MAISVEGGYPVLDVSGSARNVVTTSITVGSGANRLILVGCVNDHAASSVSSATFGGAALAIVPGTGRAHATDYSEVEWWYKIAPATSTANVVVNWSATFLAASVIYVLDGVDQATGVRNAAGTGVDSGTTASDTVAGFTAGDYVLDLMSIDSTGHSPGVTGNNLVDFATQSFGASTNEFRGSHNTTDGVMSWSWTTSGPNSHVAVAAIPAPTGQQLRPDADITTTGWSSTPLWSKIDEDPAGGDVITGTAS